MLAELRNHARERKEKIEILNRRNRIVTPSIEEEEDQFDPFAGFEKEWLDAEIAEGVTNRDVCRSLMMLMRVTYPKCRFCGSNTHPVDKWGDCKMCVDGMARTNGD